MNPLSLINRTKELFTSDISKHESQLSETVSASLFLVIGGAGSVAYDAFWEAGGQYDYVLNLSALKHVRSEKDPDAKVVILEKEADVALHGSGRNSRILHAS